MDIPRAVDLQSLYRATDPRGLRNAIPIPVTGETDMPLKKSLKQLMIFLPLAFAAAWIVNRLVLELFGQTSAYRASHSLVGILLLMGMTRMRDAHAQTTATAVAFFGLALIPCYLGTVFPDLDIRLFGIGGHRNPLFHSSLSYWPLWWFSRGKSNAIRILSMGYGIGLGSHLLWDVLDYGDVRWITGSFADRVWLGINGLVCLIPPPAKSADSETARDADETLATKN